MKKAILSLCVLVVGILFITGCSKNGLVEIDYKEFKNLIDNKESFILYVGSTDCHNCSEFTPKFEEVLDEYNIDKAKIIEIDKLSDDDRNEFNKIINVSGTPTVVFIEDGEEKSMTNRINGNVDKEKIISRFKSNEYIK